MAREFETIVTDPLGNSRRADIVCWELDVHIHCLDKLSHGSLSLFTRPAPISARATGACVSPGRPTPCLL